MDFIPRGMQKMFARNLGGCNLQAALAEPRAREEETIQPNGLGYALGDHSFLLIDRPTFTEPKVCFN